jgi:hypothetical protein
MRTAQLVTAAGLLAVLLLPGQVIAQNYASAEYNGLLHEIQTDKFTYELIELVSIDYEVTNITAEPIELGISYCDCELWVIVLDPDRTAIWSDPTGCFAEACWDTLDPRESYVRHSDWDMFSYLTEDYIDTPGCYTVRGLLAAYYPDVYFWIDLPIEIVEPTTLIPRQPATWGMVKALYR